MAREAGGRTEPQKESISFDDFEKMDIRAATILEAEKIAKTKKLLKLVIDTGIDRRTIVSGIAEHYTPEELVGRPGARAREPRAERTARRAFAGNDPDGSGLVR